jgi:signal transduction histidine kinase
VTSDREAAGLSVLLVEDNASERWLYSEILRTRGHEVTACADGSTGWDAFRSAEFGLVLLDLHLPGDVDGMEVCRRIRAWTAGPQPVILVITGDTDPGTLDRVLDLGADDYVAKPIDARLLNVRLTVAERAVESGRRRVRAEEELRDRERRATELARELGHANQELESFAYSVSHDLRAPLRTMQGFAHTLLRTYSEDLPEDAHHLLRRIIASGESAEELISDLLAYSRLSSEEIQLHPVRLEKVVDEVLERVTADVDASGATIEVARPLPEIRSHHAILVQALDNLVGNAMKFVPDDRVPHVRIASTTTDDSVVVTVEDNGVGIPADKAPRIFRVFERLSGDVHRPGTGIGLAIVRRAMERLGGRVGVESTLGEGSTFRIEIPIRTP